MKQKVKKILALSLALITVLMIIPILGVSTVAASDYSENTNSYFKKVTVVSLSATDARISGDLTKATNVKESGFYIGTSESSLKKNEKKDGAFPNCENIAYTMSKYYGNLKPETKYYYKLYYITTGGTERTSSVNWFVTKKSNTQNYSEITNSYFKKVTVISLSSNNARISGDLSKATNIKESGFYIGTSDSSLKKNAKKDGAFKNCENIAYTMSEYYGTLTPATKYYYKLYYITTNGTERTSAVNWFITSSSGSSQNLTISYNANGGNGTMSIQKVPINSKVNLNTNNFTKYGYTFSGWNAKRNSDNKWYVASYGWLTESEINSKGYNKKVYSNKQELTFDKSWTSGTTGNIEFVFYAVWKKDVTNIYNLGEETYSFANYADTHSGYTTYHCFGMSMTSAAYYLGLLDTSYTEISGSQTIYSLKITKSVKSPICFYQDHQGTAANAAIVAGGRKYKNKAANVSADWTEVVNYVKNHKYDGTGQLQLAFKSGKNGHAINFLRYEYENGQDRLYAYDNNCPSKEVYLYKDSKGNIKEAVHQSLSAIDCVALRDVKKYFDAVDKFDESGVFYANEGTISIEGAESYVMECGDTDSIQVMYEVPKGKREITIIPNVDYAEFEYLGKTYSFGSNSSDMVGIFKLANMNDEGIKDEPSFKIVKDVSRNNVKSVQINDILSMNYKSSAKLNPVINADSGAKYTTEYKSSNTSIASVDKNGNVYGGKKGSATITCTVTDEYGKIVSDTCTVTVSYAWWQWIIEIVLFGWLWY